MARRSRKSGLEQLIQALSRLPWRLCLALAPISYFGFHALSALEIPKHQGSFTLGSAMPYILARTIGLYLQYLAPLALLIAAALAWNDKRRRHHLLADAESDAGTASLEQLSWKEFEQLVGACFERSGHRVTFTADGADGGIDAIARKGGETFLIQCKQWRNRQISVRVVRELYGLIAAHRATGGYVIGMGAFTRDAEAFAQGRNVRLMDARQLISALPHKQAQQPRQEPMVTAPATARPVSPTPPAAATCPQCGSPMVSRTARQGQAQGQRFLGCSRFPKCRQTLSLPSA